MELVIPDMIGCYNKIIFNWISGSL